MPCSGQAVPVTGQADCVTEVAVTHSEVILLKCIIGTFAAICLGSLSLVVILVRSRHAFTVRPFHSGICLYIGSFVPYSVLKAVAVAELLSSPTQAQQLTAGVMLNGCFVLFFWLGFGGKIALIQLWLHLVSHHSSDGNSLALVQRAHQTWRGLLSMVVTVCAVYSAGFITLVAFFFSASSDCAMASESGSCISLESDQTPDGCQRVVDYAGTIVYYEGVCSAVVAIVFTFYAFLFNGLIYAMLTSDPSFCRLNKFQRILISNDFLRCMMRP
jgi:hypothetical protein